MAAGQGLPLLRNLANQRFGGQHQRRDRGGVLRDLPPRLLPSAPDDVDAALLVDRKLQSFQMVASPPCTNRLISRSLLKKPLGKSGDIPCVYASR
jgi:hypothetical protein